MLLTMSPPPPNETRDPDRLHALDAGLGALGRVALLLDHEFRVVFATQTLDEMVLCDDAHCRILTRPAAELFSGGLFGLGDGVTESLLAGEAQEGRRAFLKCDDGTEHLVSLSVAPLSHEQQQVLGYGAAYIAIVRPALEAQRQLDAAAQALGIVTRSESMLSVIRLVEDLHRSDATVLITGESGTGKEVVARAIHANSGRADKAFVAVNCGGIPETLIESELFGHVRGAFTGAVRDRVGRVELAKGGTLFLDEVAELSLPMQVKLLRVLQEHEYQRVGESETRAMKARIIAATNVELEKAVREGLLRSDLYYRLRVVPIHLPSLRERPEDIEPLTRFLLARIGTRTGRSLLVSADVLSALAQYHWPGNVREVENALEYAVAVCRGQTLTRENLPEHVRAAIGASSSVPGPPVVGTGPAAVVRPATADAVNADADVEPRRAGAALTSAAQAGPRGDRSEEDEASRILSALEAVRWNRQAAAEALGISRTTLWRRMQALDLE